MSKSETTERSLDRLGELRHHVDSKAVTAELRTFLQSRSNLVVAKAARITGELKLTELLPDLIRAFDRFMVDAPRLDKRCAAVTALLTALYELDFTEPAPYLAGLRHVQLEASFGPRVDEAAKLRGISAQGVLRTTYRDALSDVLPLLVDNEAQARIGAVRALATNGGEPGVYLLRLKVLNGDREPEVLAECFSGLLAASGDKAVLFVAPYASAEDPATAEVATLALGDSRLPAAFTVLQEKLQRTASRPEKKVVLIAMASSRLEQAIDLLVSLVEGEGVKTAEDAIEALAVYRRSQRITDAVRAAVAHRQEASLKEKFEREFGDAT